MQDKLASIHKTKFLDFLVNDTVLDLLIITMDNNEKLYFINVEDAEELLMVTEFEIIDFDEKLYSSLPKPRKKK